MPFLDKYHQNQEDSLVTIKCSLNSFSPWVPQRQTHPQMVRLSSERSRACGSRTEPSRWTTVELYVAYHSVWPCKKLLWDTQAEPSPGYILGLHRNKTRRLGIVFASRKDPKHFFFFLQKFQPYSFLCVLVIHSFSG